MRLVIIAMLALLMVFSIGCQERERNPQTEIVENATMEEGNAVVKQSESSSVDDKITNNETAKSSEILEEETSVQSETSSNPNSQFETDGESNNTEFSKTTEGQTEGQTNFLDRINWGIFGSLSLNLVLFLLLIKTVKSNNKHKKENAKLTKGKDYYKQNYKQALQNFESLKRENDNRFKNRPTEIKEKKVKTNDCKEFYDDERPIEYVFDNIQTPTSNGIPEEINSKVILFAGKPSDANTFSAVSSQQDEHKSIFKLILEDKNAVTARFEVIENEYILKMAANSPDTYLYHICKPVNSNQNFDGRIVTTEKGTAHLVDGKWKVNDHEKATIKFQ